MPRITKKPAKSSSSRRAPKVVKFSRKALTTDILDESRVLNIPVGAAELIAEKTVNIVEKWAKSRTMITQSDLNRAVAKEIKKYHADLAYVYQNRGKII